VTPANLDLLSWDETDDPFELVADRLGASKSRPEIQLGALGGTWGRLGGLLVSDRLWATFLLRLQAAVPDAAFGVASAALAALRAVKDAEEIALLRLAAQAADRAVSAIASGRLVGRSEADIAAEVRQRLVDEGHELAVFGIVAAGPNSASPHHEPSDRVVAAGQPLLFDIGGMLGGYSSDITRTVWVAGDEGSGPPDEYARLYEAVRRAQSEATAAARAGVACEAVDEVARRVIGDAGFGPQFIHRTGHGIGLEVHEEPYLVAGNEAALAIGNCFSVEPGVYIDGRYGARIEDIVVCTSDGPEPLNQVPRELLVVRG